MPLTPLNALPPIVSQAEWQKAFDALLEKEKAHKKATDALAAERRRMPMVAVNTPYRFVGLEGDVGLADLFAGRRQLIVYHHMLKAADTAPCPGCCLFTDMVGNLAHLNARDTTFVLVSSAPINEITAFKQRMGWNIPWYSTQDTFNDDFGVTDGFGLNVFLQNNNALYHSYFTTNRGAEYLGSIWTFLDITPLGRQETWEESPAGWPQSEPYVWWRLHDEYEQRVKSHNCCQE